MEEKSTLDSNRSAVHSLIDFDDNKNEQNQSTATTPSVSPMAHEEMLKQNVRFYMSMLLKLSFHSIIHNLNNAIFLIIFQHELLAENANLKIKIQNLERQKSELEEVNTRILYETNHQSNKHLFSVCF